MATCPRHHFDEWHNVGLAQTLRRFGVEVRTGGPGEAGRSWLRGALARSLGGGPAVALSEDALWTLRALSGGYCREFKAGQTADEARPGRYRLLMEGLEALAGLVAWGVAEDDAAEPNWAYDQQGRRYRSALPGRMREHERAVH